MTLIYERYYTKVCYYSDARTHGRVIQPDCAHAMNLPNIFFFCGVSGDAANISNHCPAFYMRPNIQLLPQPMAGLPVCLNYLSICICVKNCYVLIHIQQISLHNSTSNQDNALCKNTVCIWIKLNDSKLIVSALIHCINTVYNMNIFCMHEMHYLQFAKTIEHIFQGKLYPTIQCGWFDEHANNVGCTDIFTRWVFKLCGKSW